MSSSSSLQQTWFAIVQNYSARKLTCQTDKLVAISGIARRMSLLLQGDPYVAGLWKSTIIPCLLWSVPQSGRRISEKRAPSWSWASMRCPVTYDEAITRPGELWDPASSGGSRVVDVQVQLDSSDPFGMVSGGYIEISGQWCTIRIEGSDPAPEYGTTDELYRAWAGNLLPGVSLCTGAFTLAFTDDAGNSTFAAEPDGTLAFWAHADHTPHDNRMVTGDAMSFALDEICMPDTFYVEDSWYAFELRHVIGPYYLMVRGHTDHKGNRVYRRIGLARNIQLPGMSASVQPGKGSKERVIRLL
ncbi:hypothetical protein CONLIGDRAFT_636372 [Coniochaeta ligniaria NRRL 30616]|uniref:Uncharacterized protein n=1 Tax=Coniochaeta ligniaria NRRL 30616 TaxID=1408157 RepID=A0A1J7ICX5_9PEZI|nr:hypothetical protein CONLIGDRAFT_636372 [Coniochaeta ligniaria NRRL 30616]